MSTVTLENLTEKVRENRLKNLAENIIKYQNFSTNAILTKIDNAGYAERTLRFYIDKGIAYIKNGTACRELGRMRQYLDEGVKKCIQPLVPAECDKRRSLRGIACKNVVTTTTPPVVRVLGEINKKKIAFVVKFNSNTVMYETKEEAEAFKNGLYFGGISANITYIKYEVIQ